MCLAPALGEHALHAPPFTEDKYTPKEVGQAGWFGPHCVLLTFHGAPDAWRQVLYVLMLNSATDWQHLPLHCQFTPISTTFSPPACAAALPALPSRLPTCSRSCRAAFTALRHSAPRTTMPRHWMCAFGNKHVLAGLLPFHHAHAGFHPLPHFWTDASTPPPTHIYPARTPAITFPHPAWQAPPGRAGRLPHLPPHPTGVCSGTDMRRNAKWTGAPAAACAPHLPPATCARIPPPPTASLLLPHARAPAAPDAPAATGSAHLTAAGAWKEEAPLATASNRPWPHRQLPRFRCVHLTEEGGRGACAATLALTERLHVRQLPWSLFEYMRLKKTAHYTAPTL